MNGIRCSIWLNPREVYDGEDYDFVTSWIRGRLYSKWKTHIFGSHSEAKRELKHWRDAYPDARIVDEVEL